VGVRLEPRRGAGTHPLRWGVGGHQIGVSHLDRLKLAQPVVIYRIIHCRIIQHVIPVRGVTDEPTQFVCTLRIAHDPPPRSSA